MMNWLLDPMIHSARSSALFLLLCASAVLLQAQTRQITSQADAYWPLNRNRTPRPDA
jgi:hypothetical protein